MKLGVEKKLNISLFKEYNNLFQIKFRFLFCIKTFSSYQISSNTWGISLFLNNRFDLEFSIPFAWEVKIVYDMNFHITSISQIVQKSIQKAFVLLLITFLLYLIHWAVGHIFGIRIVGSIWRVFAAALGIVWVYSLHVWLF